MAHLVGWTLLHQFPLSDTSSLWWCKEQFPVKTVAKKKKIGEAFAPKNMRSQIFVLYVRQFENSGKVL